MAPANALAAFTLDDFESRSGSATSIIRTIAGLYLRHHEAPIARATVLELAVAASVSQPAAQTALSRLVDRGLLGTSGDGAIHVTSPAQAMFARGNRRIFTPRQMSAHDGWTLLTYSVPESLRPLRHQLRKHFGQLGGGQVSAGVWIFPEYLHDEVSAVVQALQARNHVTVFRAHTPDFPGSARTAAEQWWDLERLSRRHEDFLQTVSTMDQDRELTDALAYRHYVRLIDAWRAIPYLDPGLPAYMLPGTWPGSTSRERFLKLSRRFAHSADDYARGLIIQTSEGSRVSHTGSSAP